MPWSIAIIIALAKKANLNKLTVNDSTEDYIYNIGYSVSFLVCILPFFVYLKFNRLFRKEFFGIFKKSKVILSSSGIAVNTISGSKSVSTGSKRVSSPN